MSGQVSYIVNNNCQVIIEDLDFQNTAPLDTPLLVTITNLFSTSTPPQERCVRFDPKPPTVHQLSPSTSVTSFSSFSSEDARVLFHSSSNSSISSDSSSNSSFSDENARQAFWGSSFTPRSTSASTSSTATASTPSTIILSTPRTVTPLSPSNPASFDRMSVASTDS